MWFISLFMLLFRFMITGDQPCEQVPLSSAAPFPIGAAINTEKLKYEKNYWELALKHFNSFTPEKILKPQFIQPKKGQFDFLEADQLMAFCSERRIRLHGHTLVWDKANPHWMETFDGDKDAWDRLLQDHIHSVMRHCMPYIRSWDVVNEAFNDDGSLHRNTWLKHIGSDYILKAFRYAREVDPTAILFYNDYSLEKNDEKLTAVLAYLDDMRAKGVIVDGIGLQMHVSSDFPRISDINGAAMRIAAAGYKVHYSELDVNLGGLKNFFKHQRKLTAEQRERVRQIVAGYMKLPDDKKFGITLWGVSDNDSWLTEQSPRALPLLFDDRYAVKPAYCGFLEGLKE
jgi:endo-1,4-beta-xylanase